jgi:hypothetical protein
MPVGEFWLSRGPIPGGILVRASHLKMLRGWICAKIEVCRK